MRVVLLVISLVLAVALGTAGCDREREHAEKPQPNAELAAEPAADVPPEIVRVIERRFATLRGCYQQALKRSPELAAIFSMKFTVDSHGRARDVEILDPYFEHAALEHCFTAAFERLRFPPPADGEPNTFVYPFRFEPPAQPSR